MVLSFVNIAKSSFSELFNYFIPVGYWVSSLNDRKPFCIGKIIFIHNSSLAFIIHMIFFNLFSLILCKLILAQFNLLIRLLSFLLLTFNFLTFLFLQFGPLCIQRVLSCRVNQVFGFALWLLYHIFLYTGWNCIYQQTACFYFHFFGGVVTHCCRSARIVSV